MKKRRGILITFEGVDGCGKSTQARLLYDYLKNSGYPVIFLREPGGTPLSERTRTVLLDPAMQIAPLAELLLYEAARAQLTAQHIEPTLASGGIVICDRYFDSTTAYQGAGRGIDRTLINRLNRIASLGITPDLTFVFDVNYQTSLRRRRKQADRLEQESQAFFNRVRRGFRKLASLRRVKFLDGHKSIENNSDEVHTVVERLLRRRMRG